MGGQVKEAELRHAFYDAVAGECRRDGKTFVQDTARKAFQRACSALADKALAALGTDGLVKRLGI
jgi:hypothetical protein